LAASSFSEGEPDGPSIVRGPLVFVNVTVFSGPYVPAASTIVLALEFALAFATAATNSAVSCTL